MNELRILIVDDDELIRRGLRALLGTRSNLRIVGEASDGGDAIKKAEELKPDVIVMDFSMPGMNGLNATKEIRGIVPDTEVLIFTQHDSTILMREAVNAGARGFLLKSDVQHLVEALETIAQHQPFGLG